ncbi:hypothetical protein DIPPA_08363 [Diplonema papillatum]|nr:hypothetical protein DIPPA_08363 [Diplonema papillatum]
MASPAFSFANPPPRHGDDEDDGEGRPLVGGDGGGPEDDRYAAAMWRYLWAVDWKVYDDSVVSAVWRNTMLMVEQLLPSRTRAKNTHKQALSKEYASDAMHILSGCFLTQSTGQPDDDTLKFRIPRFLTEDEALRHTDAANHANLPFGSDTIHQNAAGSLNMDGASSPATDTFDIRTRSFLWQKLRHAQRNGATACFFLLLLSAFALVLACAILGLASAHIKGGRETIVVPGFVSGTVMLICTVIGIIGALGANETWIRCSLTGAFWTMAVLTTLVYNALSFAYENELVCRPTVDHTSTSAYGSDDGVCTEDRANAFALLAISTVGVVNSFFVTFNCSDLLGAINDGEKIQDSLLMMRYFTYRHATLRGPLEKRFGSERFGENGFFGTFNDVSPAYCAMKDIRLAATRLERVHELNFEEPEDLASL